MLLPVALAIGLNWWIDPFNRLGRNWIGVYSASERDAKIAMIEARSPAGVILGSSKTTYIPPAALDRPGFFNASFPGAAPEEMLDFVERHVGAGEAVLLGLDFFMFNEREVPLRPEGLPDTTSLPALGRYLLSGRVLLDALRDYRSHLARAPPRLAPDGSRIAAGQLARHAAMAQRDDRRVLERLAAYHFNDVVYSERRLAVLRALRTLMERRGIRFVVFINPLCRSVLQLIERLPARQDFLRFRRDVGEIFPEVVDLSDSIWSDPELFFRFDPYHYLPEVGAAFVNQEVLPRLADVR